MIFNDTGNDSIIPPAVRSIEFGKSWKNQAGFLILLMF